MSPQQSIAHYKILSKLGEGGMGAVFRATDTKLNREVAIKILPDVFAADPDRVARFTREAQVLAALNHPNIAAIYGTEQGAIVMELVEGEELKRPVPVETAIAYAKQLAAALEAAHEKGIVHRDLKPANIKITPDGVLKVLDFGLAKAAEERTGSGLGSPTTSPTISLEMTRSGVILGTAAYMSPEQARGKTVDKRADIWAFGVVLFEMLTGTMLFGGGETVSDSMVALITREPDWSALPKKTPKHIVTLLKRCLAKDPRMRLRDMGEARIAIEDAFAVEPDPARHSSTVRREQRPWVWIGVAALLALAAPAAWFLKPAPEQPMLQMEISPPKGVTMGQPSQAQLAISPDGRKLVFLATAKDGKRSMWLRPLDANASTQLPGTEEAAWPFWSPDSRSIGFFANGSLKRIDTLGGQPQVICPASGRIHVGTWSRDGVILFTETGKPIQRVPASGGAPSEVFGFDTAHEETAQQAPFFLPDGRRFLHDSTKKEREYVLASVSGDLHRPLFRTGSSPAQFVPSSSGGGWILYIVGGQLLARPFDPGKGVVTGGSIPVVDRLPLGPSWSASSNGVLAFRRASVELSRFNWAGRDGKFLDTIGAVGVAGLSTPRISPDQKAIAFSRTDDNGMSHLWLFDAARDTAARLTVESNRDEGPMWSANGAHILYLSVRGALTESASHFLVERPVNGAGPVTEIKIAAPTRPSGETHDGQILAAGPGGVVLLSRPDGARRIALIKGLNARESSISPDGRWLMYPSNVEGRTDVFVQPMPQESGGPANAAGKWQISGAGGDYPLWRRDGKEISYIAPDGKMMAVPVESGEGGFRPGKAQALFDSKLVSGDYGYRSVMREYDVSADGQRFLLNQPASDTTEMPITVIVNWPKLLQR